jgi:hypothetical protein
VNGSTSAQIPALRYALLLYGERCVRSAANNTRADDHVFLVETAASVSGRSSSTFH